MVTTAANPRRSPTRPWYSPSRWFGAVRRSNGPATCSCRQVAPWSGEPANHTSVVRVSSPGRSLRMSYQITPTVPRPSTAMAGSKAKADTSGNGLAVQGRPPSPDCETVMAPVVGDVLLSVATYTVPSGAIAALGNPGWGSSTPVSGSANMPTGCTATSTAVPHVSPSSVERLAISVPRPDTTSKWAHTASRSPEGRTRTWPEKSTAVGPGSWTSTAGDQVAPESVVRANRKALPVMGGW